MTMTIKAVIFDLDGTLLDSLEDIADSIDKMLLGRGYPVCGDPEIFRQMIGDGMDHLVARALPEEARTPEIIAAGVEEYRAHYEELWRNKTRIYDGIGEMLDALEAQGLKLAVISNKAHRFVIPMCHHFFGSQRFLGILGQRPEVERKPDAAGGLEMAAQLGVDPAECAYIGDSGVDMAFAKNCGMLGIGVRWGFRTEAELLAHGACHLISHPAELLPLLEK